MVYEDGVNTANICTSLFWRLSSKGLDDNKIQHLIFDVFSMLRNGGSFTVAAVNYELERIGWEEGMIDDYAFELIIYILEKEFDYKVTKRALH